MSDLSRPGSGARSSSEPAAPREPKGSARKPGGVTRWLTIGFAVMMLGIFVVGAGVVFVFYHFDRGLPDYHQLATYNPAVTTRVYAGDGRLIQEYSTENRVFVPIAAIPKRVIDAFISAEDQNFYTHPGVDPGSLIRVAVTDLWDRIRGNHRRMKGASTITQQVAQKFLLGKEYAFTRKIKEAILSLRIERAFTKDHILELYLNENYFGFGAYGVAAASMNYFNKSLDELTVSEAAFLAGLAKAPNNYNPVRYPDAARERRDYVIGRMVEDSHITAAEAKEAKAEPIRVRERDETEVVSNADYFAEEIRRELMSRYGEDLLYKGGLSVRTTLNPEYQQLVYKTLRGGLVTYDRRHGWRGPIGTIPPGPDAAARFSQLQPPPGLMETWELALVEAVQAEKASILVRGGSAGTIPLSEMKWARATLPEQHVGGAVNAATQVLHVGDVVAVERVEADGDGGAKYPENTYGLRQIPDVEGAMVVLDPHTGRVLALTGGFSYATSQFDRATQAQRQPGSAFKPFVYLTAMENGYTPSTLVLDAPFVMDQGPGLPKWKPHNYTGKYLGLATLRAGLEESQNLMTIRIAQAVGMDKVAETAEKFGIVEKMQTTLANSIGATETTPLKLTTAYAELVNGGKKVTPSLVDRIQDRNGKTIWQFDTRACDQCASESWNGQGPPQLPDDRPQLADPASIYQVIHMMEGVVERGTGVAVRAVGKPIAGKTGTSNDIDDTWFMGFTPNLVAGVFVGFDKKTTLGPQEQGATAAAPIFRDFMMGALKNQPATPFRVPPGISLVRVDHDSGKPAEPGDKLVILEAFKTGTSPYTQATIRGQADQIDTDVAMPSSATRPAAGTIY